jgi:hypothetical protein
MIEKLKKYIVDNGGEILKSGNIYEFCRFKVDGVTSVIYSNKSGFIGSGFQGQGKLIWEAWWAQKPFPSTAHKNKKKMTFKKKCHIINGLVEREGPFCFYCQQPLEEHQSTIEHLIPKSAGGLNHMSNYALACVPCNQAAGSLSLMEKIKLREKNAL